MARRDFRLAIILAAPCRSGLPRDAHLLARLFAERPWPGIGQVEVVIGLPEQDGAVPDASLTKGVSIRSFRWSPVEPAIARLLFDPDTVPEDAAMVWLPDDGGRQFRDADGWILVADNARGAVPWLRPTAVFCADLLPRRIGGPADEGAMQALEAAMTGWRRARCVFASTPSALSDVISYAGVHPDRALLAPLLAMPARAPLPSASPAVGARPGILWATGAAPHQDPRSALLALRCYVAAGGGLDVTVCGAGTQDFDPACGMDHPSARAFAAAPEVLARTRFAGLLPEAAWLGTMAAHGIAWHAAPAGGGTGLAFEAARLGIQFVSSDTPPMRHLCDRHGVAALFHPPRDPEAAAAALLEAERRLRAGTPPAHALRAAPEAEVTDAYGRILARIAGHV